MEFGWELADPTAMSMTRSAYQAFIADSKCDLGIAKHAYVASRSGWFSDRSLCYLAMGRPVLHQDTGYPNWLPATEGVLPFTDTEDLLRGLCEIDRNLAVHSKAAREVAEAHFEAREVLSTLLTEVDVL